MRGQALRQASMLCLVSPESRVPADHPLRGLKRLADSALSKLEPVFQDMYSGTGRPSVPPERLLKGMLLMALYSVRSERQLCEQLEYNLLFRWFLDMDMVEEAFDASTYSRNRDRFLEHEVAAHFFAAVRSEGSDLMSDEHFSVDGTMLEAWGSLKSFRRKEDDVSDSNGWGDFRGECRGNESHESKTDPDARLWRKGKGREAKLSYMGHALMENRHGLLVDFRVSEANGFAEREQALGMLRELGGTRRVTAGADKAYDTRGFVAGCRELQVTPHVARNEHGRRRSAIDGRTSGHVGYEIRQRVRKRIESVFGWLKTIGGIRRSRFRGRIRTELVSYVAGAAYNLLRITNIRRIVASSA